MKKLYLSFIILMLAKLAHSQATNLNGVTFGFGAGYNYTLNKTYDYSLATDGSNNLRRQQLSKGGFVMSSIIMVKLHKIATDEQDNSVLIKQSKVSNYRALKTQFQQQQSSYNFLKQSKGDTSGVKQSLAVSESSINSIKQTSSFWDHVSVNLALNLVDITPDVSFNKNINGGIGLGYFFTENLQAALFYDVSRVRQLRDYIVDSYLNKPVPNSTGGSFNALDSTNNDLFYDKTVSGFSLKLIFSIGNKQTASASTP